MENNAQKVKEATDIVDFIGKYLSLKRAGANYKALCPFHDEKTPSFMVSPQRQTYKCFGCDEGGDVIEFVMKMEHLSFPEALKMLADKAGIQLEQFSKKRSLTSQRQSSIDKNRLYLLNDKVSQFFRHQLAKSPQAKQARAFLDKRKITPPTQKLFQIGWAPSKSLILKFLREQGFSAREVSAAGAPERQNLRLTFPISDPIGNIVGFTARALNDEQLPKYFNTPETTIFKKSRILYGLAQARKEIWKRGYAIVVEGQMDVIASHQVGVRNTVASSGTALTDQHLKALARICSKIILALDSDEAGVKATQKILVPALGQGLALKIVTLPEGIKDAGEAIARDPLIWKRAIQKATYALDWVWQTKLGKRSPENLAPEEKAALVAELTPLLGFIKDPVEHGAWIGRLAGNLDIAEEAIYDKLETATNPSQDSQIPSARAGLPTKPLAQNPLAKPISPPMLLLCLLTLYPKAKKEYSSVWRALKEKLGKPAETVLFDVSAKYQSYSENELRLEIKDIIANLKRHQTEQLKARFARQIAQAEKAGDYKALKRLLRNLQAKIKPETNAKTKKKNSSQNP